jgi:hypothetical protein
MSSQFARAHRHLICHLYYRRVNNLYEILLLCKWLYVRNYHYIVLMVGNRASCTLLRLEYIMYIFKLIE